MEDYEIKEKILRLSAGGGNPLNNPERSHAADVCVGLYKLLMEEENGKS